MTSDWRPANSVVDVCARFDGVGYPNKLNRPEEHARMRERGTAEFEARIHEVLEQDGVVNGLALPAGTEIQWAAVGRTQLLYASPSETIRLFGLHVVWLGRAEAGSDLQLPEPEPAEGWTCDKVGVRVSDAGRLRSWKLAAGRI